jgi:hypothetical protein
MHHSRFICRVIVYSVVTVSIASFGKSLPPIVDFDQLLDAPSKFDGRLVRVRGFMRVEIPSRDVGSILFYPDKRHAIEDPGHRCILISPRSSQVAGDKAFRSGWVEITARFVSEPAAGGKHIQALTEIQKLDPLGEDSGNH